MHDRFSGSDRFGPEIVVIRWPSCASLPVRPPPVCQCDTSVACRRLSHNNSHYVDLYSLLWWRDCFLCCDVVLLKECATRSSKLRTMEKCVDGERVNSALAGSHIPQTPPTLGVYVLIGFSGGGAHWAEWLSSILHAVELFCRIPSRTCLITLTFDLVNISAGQLRFGRENRGEMRVKWDSAVSGIVAPGLVWDARLVCYIY